MSMGLVAYGSSDESDNDDEASLPKINKNTSSLLKDNVGEGLSQKGLPASLKLDNTKNNHFQETLILSNKPSVLPLPSPKSSINDLDVDIKRLKSAGTVKIAIPSLSELQNEELEQPLKKKLKPSQKGSGLFALLPNPKNQGLIPKSVNNKYTKTSTTPKLKSIPLTVEEKPSIFSDNYDSEDENDVTNNKNDLVDFFSLEKKEDIKPILPVPEVNTKPSTKANEEPDNLKLTFSAKNQNTAWSRMQPSSTSQSNTEDFIKFQNEDLKLDEEALQQLCGRRGRDKLQTGNVQLIDLSGDEIMPDSREWLTKQLTEEQNHMTQSHKKKDGPTSQQRRKHQITYLAFQAKEHELELKNQWANNRMSRKQTQAKYGF